MHVPPCLPQLPHDLDIDRSAADDGLTHTVGINTLASGNIVEVNYKDNRNTFTDQFAAFGTVTMTNVTDKPRTIRYRYRGVSGKRTKGEVGTPFIIEPTTQEGFSLDVCVDEIDGVVMSIVGEKIPPETTKIIDFSILATFDEPVNQWDRNDDGVVDTSDLAVLMTINGIKADDVNICISLMDYDMPALPEEPIVSEYPIEIRLTLNELPNDDVRANHWVIPLEDITSEVIAGDLDITTDTGAGGPAALVVKSYGYASVNVAPTGEQTTAEWVAANPDQQWKVDIVRDGNVIKTINSEVIQNPDATSHYGDGVWFRSVLNPDEYQVGDQWILYGY